ncbi:WhiB family transcription factor [Mycobacterium phage Nanosmite]|nr:WhiB family transcription factor [Mycobacterium phage Nanosmite]
MSKLWNRADEWTEHAPCAGRIDFIIDPETLGPDRTEAVKATCGACPVRPECIKENLKPVSDFWRKTTRPSNAIWVAGEWLPELPETNVATARKELEAKRAELLDSLPDEVSDRPDTIL